MRITVRQVVLVAFAALALISPRPGQAQGPESLITLHNEIRAAHGLPSFTFNNDLGEAARRHSRDMADHALAGHIGSDGSTPEERIRAAGFGGGVYGENVGYAWATDEASLWKHREMLAWWMSSPGHRANILNPSFTQIGMSRLWLWRDGQVHAYWCVTFGGA